MSISYTIAINSQGQPACLKNTTTAGLPSIGGSLNFAQPGAFLPTTGAGAISTGGGGGVAHDCQLFGTERFAKGFVIGVLLVLSFENDFVSGMERALDGMPALRMAILVVSFANMVRCFEQQDWDVK